MRKKKKTLGRIEYEVGSGNVFADLGLPNPERRLAKALLSIVIERGMEERDLTVSAAAKLMRCTRADLSRAIRGNSDDFSMNQALLLLDALGMDVWIKVEPKSIEARRKHAC